MQEFTEEHSKLLLNKEWLVATNDSTPYLFKFTATVDLTVLILVTDTRSVWTEVLNSKQFGRRWRACNPDNLPEISRDDAEEEWRVATQQLLARAHSLGGLPELSFDIVESNYADLAIELEGEAFKWRWETCLQGGRFSTDIISKHLVLPLISLAHLAFTSTSAVGESTGSDLEKTVDKVGRTARRSVDTHVQNTLSRPRVATALRRITALFNSAPEPLPSILLDADTPDLQLPPQALEAARGPSPTREIQRPVKSPSPMIELEPTTTLAASSPGPEPAANEPATNADSGSATESDSDSEAPAPAPAAVAAKGKGRAPTASPARQSPVLASSPAPSKASRSKKPVSSDSDSSPIRPPAKKAKPQAVSSSDEDSEAERKKRLAKAKSGSGGAARGTKQPIKRGGRRF
uniref:XLF-like N-terminal domain-containing protein n=1 Tax=Mycena chlorophos TaxID=658473 RepID=A0ABQ0MBW9_MYCCL|nr:predicted protein [Mycena chlorophos]